MITVELCEDTVEDVVLQSLQSSLEFVINPVLVESLHTVIAWYSRPGAYLDGKYDQCGLDESP